jgi:aspartyl-tRNA(Asn)/glutamyl-tRNA(Gln) amidotransferase subunit C
MLPGVRPSICFAWAPTCLDDLLAVGPSWRIATTDGSFSTMPLSHVDQGVGRAEVDGEIVGEITAEKSEHVFVLCARRQGSENQPRMITYPALLHPTGPDTMSHAASIDDVKRIAHLARIRVSAEDAEQTRDQLNGIFELIERDAGRRHRRRRAHGPRTRCLPAPARRRSDRSDRREPIKRVAPQTENGLYLVPKVIE